MEWRNLIIECLQSGLPKKDWCKDRGISTRKFYYWQKIIREEELALIGQDKLNDMFPDVIKKDDVGQRNDFYEVPAMISDTVVDSRMMNVKGETKAENIISFQYRGCDLRISTGNLDEALLSIFKVLDHA